MAANPDIIQNTLLAYLSEHVLAEGVTITPETDLPSLDVDSVTIVEMAMHLEERLGIEIPVNLLTPEHTRTVSAFAAHAVQHGKPLR
ncbi:MAG: acyl carrier protein [Flavobacteriales bacterium]|nr:acyl carrier protein [Flavobacteriales bacterium]